MLALLDGSACVLMVLAAASDIRRYRIPNWISLALAGLFLARLALAPHGLWASLAVAAAVLALGFGLFAARLFGAGDAKLLAAISLWVGPGLVLNLLTMTALAGGVLAAAILVCRRIASGSSNAALAPAGASAAEEAGLRAFGGKRVSTPMPYGVAIAAGGLWCVAFSHFGS